jgi:hypothetical protein
MLGEDVPPAGRPAAGIHNQDFVDPLSPKDDSTITL